MVKLLIWASPGMGVAGAKNDLWNSLDKLDDLKYMVEALIASPGYPDLVGAYWKRALTPKSTSYTQPNSQIINYRA